LPTARAGSQSGPVSAPVARTKQPSVPPPIPAAPLPPAPLPPAPSPMAPIVIGSATPHSELPDPSEVVALLGERVEPPPTRIGRLEALGDRPFAPPKVLPIPEVPESGLIAAARYAVVFLRARWQRRGAIKSLAEDIKQDTGALDQVLGSLGRAARAAQLDNRVLSAENAAITAAEEKRAALDKEGVDIQGRKTEEASKFTGVEGDRTTKVGDAERQLADVQRELQNLEGQRRGLRDRRKDIERRQRAYLKAAEDRDEEAGSAAMGDARSSLRSSAEGHRREAAALEPERQEADRKLQALEKPIAELTAKVESAKNELDVARRSLDDAREGHVHRLAELDAEQKRKAKESAQTEAEIARRLVTLGTLVNLNRVDKPEFSDLYARIDNLRTAIGARTTEIDKLTAERDAFDKPSLVRGLATIGGGVVLLVTLIVLLRACV
jgi:hypothetical protein